MSVIIKGKNPRKPHTVRYWHEGSQRERSFATAKEAKDFKIKVDHDTRAQIFVDDRLGREDFGAAVDAWLDRHAVRDSTRKGYRATARAWVKPAFSGRTVVQVANDRDRVTDLLVKDMGHLSVTRCRQARTIITGTIEEAVKAGKLAKHNLHDIEVLDNGPKNSRDDFVFPSHEQVAYLADKAGISIWLMRGCGLRICEALGVHKEEFCDGGKTLRLTGQASREGKRKVPLKHRKAGEYRDVPVPTWLWEKVKDLPEGPLCPGNGDRLYQHYTTVQHKVLIHARLARIPAGFRPHSLRHAFASVMLARGIPITDVAKWLGHKDINETFRTYGHLVPNAAGRAVAALDAEYAEWSAA